MTKPTIDDDNLAALNIDGLLGQGDSNYGGLNIERDMNIEVATESLNGTLVPPGEEFSFNGAIGEITERWLCGIRRDRQWSRLHR